MWCHRSSPDWSGRAAVALAACRAIGVLRRARRLAGDRSGVTSLEYAIIGSFIFAAIAGALYGYGNGLGFQLANTFGVLSAHM
jgi:Flp pilus assembly pilin Flp